jgi:hypothetical protein
LLQWLSRSFLALHVQVYRVENYLTWHVDIRDLCSQIGNTAAPPSQHLSKGQLAAAMQPGAPAATAAMPTAQAAPSTAAAAQPNSSAPAPVKLKLKAPKLLIKGSFSQAADSDGGAGVQTVTKNPKQRPEPQRPEGRQPDAIAGGPVSPGGLEERQQRKKKRRRESDQPQGHAQKPLMAGLITPSASEQGGGGGGAATSTAHGGAVSGGLATPSSAAPASSAQVLRTCLAVAGPFRHAVTCSRVWRRCECTDSTCCDDKSSPGR